MEAPPADADPFAQYVCSWPDGDKHEIALTNEQVREWVKGNVQRHENDVFWEAEHPVTHHRISVKLRLNHHLMLSVYEQTKWLCGVNVKEFGEEALPYDDNGRPMKVDGEHASLKTAMAMLQPLAEKFAANEVSRDDLCTEKYWFEEAQR